MTLLACVFVALARLLAPSTPEADPSGDAWIQSEIVGALLKCEAKYLLFPEYRWVMLSDFSVSEDQPLDLRVKGTTSFARAKGKRIRYAQPDDLKRFSTQKKSTMILHVGIKREAGSIVGYFGGIGLNRDGYFNVFGGVHDPVRIVWDATESLWRCD
jgi:hypothetical protein